MTSKFIGTAFLQDGTLKWGEISYLPNQIRVYDTAKLEETIIDIQDLDRVEMDLLAIPTEKETEEEEE